MIKALKTPHLLISLISLISLIPPTFAQPSFSWINPNPVGWDLNAIAFSDAQTGWAVGKQGTVILSANSGRNWRPYDLRTDQELTDICFVDRSHGWISGMKGSVYYTTDGGRYWGEYRLPYRHPIGGIQFLDADSGFAVTLDGLIYRTTNGGEDWEPSYFQGDAQWAHSFTDVCFVDSLRGWVIGADGVVKRTINGGKLWQHETLPSKKNPDFAFHMNGLHFIDEYTGWAVGEEGRIVRTQNGGRVWREQMSGTESTTLLDVFFRDGQQGWAVGEKGTLLYTEDGGELWLQLPTQAEGENPLAIQAICQSFSGEIWIAGEEAFLQFDIQRNHTWQDVTSATRRDLRQARFSPELKDIPFLLTAGGELLQKHTRYQVVDFPEKVNFRKMLYTDRSHGFLLEKKDNLWYCTDGGGQWTKADMGSQTGRFYDIAFADKNHGWIIGAKGLVWVTEDEGKSWRSDFIDSREDFWHIQFANDQVGYMASLQGEVWQTHDAGKHWNLIETPRKTLLTDMHVIGNSGQEIALITADGMCWQTSTGGRKWRKQFLTADHRLVRMNFRNEKDGLILTSGNTYYYTQNGGKKWKEGFLPSFARPRDVLFYENQTLIVGDNGLMLSLTW